MTNQDICPKCGGDKNINGFSNKKKTCKKCISEYNKQYGKENPRKEKKAECNKKYREENKQKIKESKSKYNVKYNPMYYQKNKDKINARRRIYTKKRRENDPVFKLRQTLRNRICDAVKRANTKKANHTMELIGCCPKFIKAWLEHQFELGMTFENHGSLWHIDHVKPCASFNLLDEEEQKICFNWKNLRPLIGDENLSKGDEVIPELIATHKIKAEEFLKQNPQLIVS